MHTEAPGQSGLRVAGVGKSFERAGRRIEVLREVTFCLRPGQSLAIAGPSGSGKSTLLHMLGSLDRPTAGSITIDGREPISLSEPELARFRNREIGFVFQDHHLLPQYSALENVLIPTMAGGSRSPEDEGRARELLGSVGLADRLEHYPAELSGGECQRTAVARALINRPGLLLCDEPTGNLDQVTADAVADLLFDLHRARNNMLIAVTHSLALAARFERRLELRDGRCVEA